MDALLPILRRGVHVVLSDVDCVWLHDPNPMVRGLVPGYEDFAHADLIVSTDCHNPKSDYDSDGCFGDLLDKNTGVMAIRATPNGIPIAPHISPYLPISPYISLYLRREHRVQVVVGERPVALLDLALGLGLGLG